LRLRQAAGRSAYSRFDHVVTAIEDGGRGTHAVSAMFAIDQGTQRI